MEDKKNKQSEQSGKLDQIIQGHDFDGIQEYDNPMPRWWVWMFVICVIWAAIYAPYYHFFGGKLPIEVYNEEIAEHKAKQEQQNVEAASEGASKNSTAKIKTPIVGDATKGFAIYTSNCVSCHGVAGAGIIGPNLADNFWIYGNTKEAIVKVITVGVPAKGMIAWKAILSPKKIADVTSYIISLKGTKPSGAKEPEGIEYP